MTRAWHFCIDDVKAASTFDITPTPHILPHPTATLIPFPTIVNLRMSAHIPSEAPPSYTDATASNQRPATLQVPQASTHRVRNGIPPEYRRSMEDEGRPLPQGWIRQYDDESHHQFFVDTTRSPPRSIWQHPYDDEDYMSSLDPQERTRIKTLHKTPSQADIEAESSADDEDYEAPHGAPPKYNTPTDRQYLPTSTCT